MPNKDGTGPEGKGSKTGRGLGDCKSEKSSNEIKSYGKGEGIRRGRAGRGNRKFQNIEK